MSSEFDRLKRRQKLDYKRRRKHGDNRYDSSWNVASVRALAPDQKRGARLAQWQDEDD